MWIKKSFLLAACAACWAQEPAPKPEPDETGPPVLKRGGRGGRKEAPPPPSFPPPGSKTMPAEGPENAPVPTAAPAAAAAEPGAPSPAPPEGVKIDLISRARMIAGEFTESLPNFICDQETARQESRTLKPSWKVKDRVQVELMYVDGKEDYRNVRINGKPLKKGTPEDSGSWSTGDFGTTLADLMSPATDAQFKKNGADTVNGIAVEAYAFTVAKDNSHWEIRYGASIKPAYKGTVYIDPESARVIRLEMDARLPQSFEMDKVEMTVDYNWVTIANEKYLLPSRSDNLACQRGTFNCSRNEITFKNYRKFGVESTISTTESSVSFGGEDKTPPPSGKPDSSSPAAEPGKPAETKPAGTKKP